MSNAYVVYAITNTKTGFRYIGSSKSAGTRKAAHFAKLANGKHNNHLLQSAYNQDGKDCFEWSILETDIDGETIDERESAWVETYAQSGVYNIKDPKNGKKDIKPHRPNSKNNLRRLYLTHEEYQTLFNAAWHKRKFTPDVLDGNQLIAEYCVAHAEKDLESEEK